MQNFHIALAVAIAFSVTAILGVWCVPFLKRLNFGQTIREEGPKWHKKKQGTPTMGGIMFIIGMTVSLIALYIIANESIFSLETSLSLTKFFAGILMAIAFGLIGFADDYIGIKKKRNLGLTEKQKLVLQFLIAGAYLFSLYLAGGTSETVIPFLGTVDLGFFYYILAALVIVGMVNAVNFADGVDGLCSTVTLIVAIAFIACTCFLNYIGMAVFAAALAGACLGFLVWNFNPAKVFMGDTGSLFLGGTVCALAFAINRPIILLPMGIIYIIEILSVVLQVSYFKLTKGKRLFKMSPIHHHFELCGWSEMKICAVFGTVTILGGLIAVLSVVYA
ncbi:MAG: phospho-N-acetylmuramoyl-pentapeptide-transferase [Clostridia bacterium]